jgi:hypothetical protein
MRKIREGRTAFREITGTDHAVITVWQTRVQRSFELRTIENNIGRE